MGVINIKARLMIVFSFDNCHILKYLIFSKKNKYIGPGLPDYSYDKLPDGGRRYTFTDVNDGIGVVASKQYKIVNSFRV